MPTSSKASSRATAKTARREAILDAGEACLLEAGYDGLKMTDVANAAEVAKGTVYLYFPSRDALCAAVAERAIGAALGPLRRRAEQQPTGLAALNEVLARLLGQFDGRPEHVRVVIDWWRRAHIDTKSESFRAYKGRAGEMIELLTSLFERGQTDGTIRKDIDAFHHALFVFSTVLGTQLFTANPLATRARMGEGFDPQAFRRAHLESIMRSLRSDPPSQP